MNGLIQRDIQRDYLNQPAIAATNPIISIQRVRFGPRSISVRAKRLINKLAGETIKDKLRLPLDRFKRDVN